ncbi:type IV secretory system conjugative DNA transfer family protein [Streptomyces sp. NPDC048290]|uniref:type IV secretory system conjugative DNA transfer family protein n=1 Tax=Streptomyces sp. NPDC048290 TaxID=3155811 RepID=UPI00344843B2
MGRDDHRQDGQGGIPDGLLVGLLAFLLGMTLMVWSATLLSGWFAHGTWPEGVTFVRTPLAIRELATEPHDMPGAWPDTPTTQLSGYGLFWGLFIGQLMVLIVLTIFVLGTTARYRAGRARRRAERLEQLSTAPERRERLTTPPDPLTKPLQQPAYEVPTPRTAQEQQPPPAPATPAPTPAPWESPALRFAPPEHRRTTAAQALRDAEGPALVVTSDPALWQDTKDARAKLGPVHLYDPTHRCDTPARLHWSPTSGCENKATAAERATALLAPVRPTARLDQAVADTAETLLRSCLHAAALDGRTVRHVHRWAQGNQIQDAVRTLRTHPKAAPGAAGELEAALTSHPERRDIAQELAGRALSALFTVNVREACTPNRADALALDSFVHEGGTLYVVGESIEDPRANPGAMPLLTALVSSVVEHGRHMAERSSSGRLDPPLSLILDDLAAVAPIPALPALLSHGTGRGLPTLALLRSREQARTRWPGEELPVS